MRNHGVIFIKTKKGYHVVLLLDELPPNGSLYSIDKFGVKRKIGDVLSSGRQAQDLGSPEKIQPTQKVECKEKINKKIKSDIKSMEVKTTVLKSPKKSKNEQTIIKLAQIIKRELFRQKVKRDKPIYKYMNELIIIRTENSKELKAFLQKKRIDYETYPYDAKQTHREKWLKDIDLANKDEKRNKEIAE
ncbi:700_t:CDS:2 [Entrophospora sp. SA101]|nr:700_t:CDS:2 [Entrophospora sp. SA101]